MSKEPLTDEQIRKLFANITIPISDDYDELVQEKIKEGLKLDEQKSSKKSSFKYISPKVKRLVAAVAIVVGLSTVGMTVYAAASSYLERMDSLSDEEKMQMISDVENANTEAYIFSRPFSERERQRLKELREKYISEGFFPERTMPVVESINENSSEALYVVLNQRYFNFPSRELSDEELLEYIDFECKQDYALKNRSDTFLNALDLMPDKELEIISLKEIQLFFNESLTEYKLNIKHLPIALGADWVEAPTEICFFDNNLQTRIVVQINAVDGRINTIDAGHSYLNGKCNKAQMKDKQMELLDKVCSFYGSDVCDSYDCIYELRNDSLIEDGIVTFRYCIMGHWIIFEYDVNSNSIVSVFFPREYRAEIEENNYEQISKNNGTKFIKECGEMEEKNE